MDNEAKMFKQGFSGEAETSDMIDDAVEESAPVAEMPDQQDAAPGEPAAVEPPMGDEVPAEEMTPEEKHKEAAWAGRLRKREEELRAREEALKAAPAEEVTETVETTEETGEEPVLEDETTEGEEAITDDEFNPDDPEQASARIANDFGDDFLRMLRAIFRVVIGETLSEVSPQLAARFAQIENGLSSMADGMTAQHYESIEEAHPDFLEIAQAPEFSAWIESMPPEDADKAKGVINSGTSRQIIKLISQYKESGQGQGDEEQDTDAIDEAAMKAAAGVRSNAIAPQMDANQSTDPMEAFRRGFKNAGK